MKDPVQMVRTWSAFSTSIVNFLIKSLFLVTSPTCMAPGITMTESGGTLSISWSGVKLILLNEETVLLVIPVLKKFVIKEFF